MQSYYPSYLKISHSDDITFIGRCVTSHPAIFQLNDNSFKEIWPAGYPCHEQLGRSICRTYHDMGIWTPKNGFNLLAMQMHLHMVRFIWTQSAKQSVFHPTKHSTTEGFSKYMHIYQSTCIWVSIMVQCS